MTFVGAIAKPDDPLSAMTDVVANFFRRFQSDPGEPLIVAILQCLELQQIKNVEQYLPCDRIAEVAVWLFDQ